MNNLALMKNCPGGWGVHGNLNWMPGYYITSKKIVISYRMSARPSVFLYESALYRCYNTILPVLGPFHRPQGWTG